jgi:hypothetical protein
MGAPDGGLEIVRTAWAWHRRGAPLARTSAFRNILGLGTPAKYVRYQRYLGLPRGGDPARSG